MKRYILLLLFIITASLSYAQISYNVKAGVNLSNWTEGGMDAKFGYKIGGGIEFSFNDVFSFQPSLLLSSKGAKMSGYYYGDYTDYEAKVTVNQMYLELPLMAAARFEVSDNVAMVFYAGPYLAYGIGGKTKMTVEDFGSYKFDTFGKNTITDPDDYKLTFDGLDRFDAGIGLGVAAEFGKILVGVEAQFGLTKITKGDENVPKNLNYSLVLGYKF